MAKKKDSPEPTNLTEAPSAQAPAPADADTLYAQAQVHLENHKAREALDSLRQALALRPEDPRLLGLSLMADDRLREWADLALSPAELAQIGATIERLTDQGRRCPDGDANAQRCGVRWYGMRARRLYQHIDHRGWDEALALLAHLPAEAKKGTAYEPVEAGLRTDRLMLERILAGDRTAMDEVRDGALQQMKDPPWKGLLCTRIFWDAMLAADPRPAAPQSPYHTGLAHGPWWRGLTLLEFLARHQDRRHMTSTANSASPTSYPHRYVAAQRLIGGTIDPFKEPGSAPLMRELLDLGLVERDIRAPTGYGLLHHYAMTPATAALLLDAGWDPNMANASGNTPLHNTSKPAIARLLLAAGADPNRRNAAGQTPLEHALAKRSDYREVLPVLRAASATGPAAVAAPTAQAAPPYPARAVPVTALRAAATDNAAILGELQHHEDDETVDLGALAQALIPDQHSGLARVVAALPLLPTPAAEVAALATATSADPFAFRVIVGDVVLATDWSVIGHLLVIGSVSVTGVLSLGGNEHSLTVSGSVTASAVSSCGSLVVCDGIRATGWVYAFGSDGQLIGDIDGPVVLADDHSTEVSVSGAVVDLSCKEDYAAKARKTLPARLHPGCLKADGGFDAGAARRVLADCGSILKPKGLDQAAEAKLRAAKDAADAERARQAQERNQAIMAANRAQREQEEAAAAQRREAEAVAASANVVADEAWYEARKTEMLRVLQAGRWTETMEAAKIILRSLPDDIFALDILALCSQVRLHGLAPAAKAAATAELHQLCQRIIGLTAGRMEALDPTSFQGQAVRCAYTRAQSTLAEHALAAADPAALAAAADGLAMAARHASSDDPSAIPILVRVLLALKRNDEAWAVLHDGVQRFGSNLGAGDLCDQKGYKAWVKKRR